MPQGSQDSCGFKYHNIYLPYILIFTYNIIFEYSIIYTYIHIHILLTPGFLFLDQSLS